MRILLLGKSGMLGSCFLKHLAGIEDFEMFAFSRNELDINDYGRLEKSIKDIAPDVVINCSAYTNVDGAETEKEAAMKINGEACGIIAKACRDTGSTLIHFSTDYVFDGGKSEGYSEEEETNPLSVYGKSKLMGEKLIQWNMENYYIIRTSWLFGENGKNFVSTMLKLSETKNELDIVDDQIGSPTFTSDLCRAVLEFFLGPYFADLDRQHDKKLETLETERLVSSNTKYPFGIYHLTNSGALSWYDFAVKIFEFAGIDMNLNRISSEKFNRPAKRPSCSILLNNKLPKLRSFEDALKAFLPLILPKS